MTSQQWFDDMEAKIPRGGVRSRFAPSPTGYMHLGGMRTALYAYLIAKSLGGTFILRIEDTDQARLVEGAAEMILRTLRDAGLRYDEGPDVGGPVPPYVQSERKPLYRPYAELLCERGAAYYCFCGHVSHEERDHEDADVDDPCRALDPTEAQKRAATEPHVIRMKTPREGSTTLHDEVFGDITVENKTLDDMVLLKSDGLPTYNFANVIDDHLMGITHVLRGAEYISSAPKYTLLYDALGWKNPVYITVSSIMRDERQKLSKRLGDPTYDDLLAEGYLPGAVLNYIALLGWSPGGEREIFSLSELEGVFSISGISRSPALFDKTKLRYFNAEYIRATTAEDFAGLAEPYIRRAVHSPDADINALAELIQPRCELLTEIPEMIDFIDALPEYSTQLFVHKKSKTDERISLDMLRRLTPVLTALPDWTRGDIYAACETLAAELEAKNALVMWPLRIAVSGKAVTPGGAAEIAAVLGREESLRRIDAAIDRLQALQA
ncbi:MAG: glutamate--tRNA ligase [Oscillospiraceae bacterium]|jgi:glutamyl-tRNA synthetase|nr:glutamate--tRNA ligase [Oscillospiraceae bacterium]